MDSQKRHHQYVPPKTVSVKSVPLHSVAILNCSRKMHVDRLFWKIEFTYFSSRRGNRNCAALLVLTAIPLKLQHPLFLPHPSSSHLLLPCCLRYSAAPANFAESRPLRCRQKSRPGCLVSRSLEEMWIIHLVVLVPLPSFPMNDDQSKNQSGVHDTHMKTMRSRSHSQLLPYQKSTRITYVETILLSGCLQPVLVR